MVGTTLAENGVQNHHSIHMVPRFKGGMERSLPINRATDIFFGPTPGELAADRASAVVPGVFSESAADARSAAVPGVFSESAVFSPAALQMRLDRLEAQMGELSDQLETIALTTATDQHVHALYDLSLIHI